MKRNLFAILILLPLLTSCGALSELTKVPMPLTQTITIPAIPIAGAMPSITTPDIKVNIDSVLTSSGMSKNLIQSIKLSSMDFTLTSPSDKDLSFLSSVKVSLLYGSAAPIELASTSSTVSTGTTVMPFTVKDVDLKDYLSKFNLKVTGTTNKPTTVPYTVTLNMKLIIDLNILGL